ncbi:hypothetical protein QJS04_geneDACA000121 [Acorus gramineus]|uniref:Uncharacterized protein n=1 Tax=Acorus gramineus TaxID=55184 RepID=A0AAV9ARY4_ACOGR|nr:hypothetical protein QJS04_geneDACA000121 [Acorus gramineus]
MEIIKRPGGEADVQSLIKAIKASEVLENRIPLISQLGDLQITEASELASLVECLLSFWEDSQCSGASQCALNKTILLIAAKYFELGTCSHLQQFLILGIKAGMWCNKHVHMEVLSMEDSPEERHSDIFLQLILEDLSFCSAAFSSMAKNPILGEKALMLSFEQFISEQLHLTRASITDIKKIHSASSEVPKVVQVVLDASVKLCRAYSQAVKWHCDLADQDTNEGSIVGGKRADDVAHAINIAACTVGNLCKLGVLAAAGGGTLVSVLNASWKGVVTILQLGKGVLSGSIDIREIILSLISLSVESLRRTAEAWFLKETIDLSEAKRMCLLVKFYLINTVRVTSMYPIEAFSIYKEITQCVLIITSLRILLSKEIRQRAGSEALYEAVEPTSFCLLNTLLNSTDLVEDKKFEIMDWLFPDEGKTISRHPVHICDTTTNPADEIFSMNCETVSSAGALLLGRFILFLNLLKNSPDSREELVLGISRKLGFLLDTMVNEDVYSSVLVLHTPDLCASVPSTELNWQPMFDFVLHSLKTFMIVAASNPAWQEVEFFLLKNIIHPHFLCREIITELWCFFIRHANAEVLDSILDTLCSLLKVIALSEPALTPLCSLRKIARTLCNILTSAPQCSVDQVYSSITDDYISSPHILSAVRLALLIEGIPLNSLSDQRKRLSTQRIISAYHNSMEKNSKNLEAGTLSGSFCGVVLGLPVVALSAALISR